MKAEKNPEEIYTSTGVKIAYHTEVMGLFKNRLRASPISLQIAPTSTCNLNCSFCSNTNRRQGESLQPEAVKELFRHFWSLRSVEWTGGGEPLLYEHINDVIQNASLNMLSQGLITNGTMFKNLNSESLSKLKWIRVSLNSLDYFKGDIEIPKFEGTLGFSYVLEKKFEDIRYTFEIDKVMAAIKKKLDYYVKKYDPVYVRIVPDCQTTLDRQKRNNVAYGKMIEKWGKPYFYQAKEFRQPERCWWGYFKPFILHDGWVYPCSSVVLNDKAKRQFHKKFRWVKLEDFAKIYSKNAEPYPTELCSHCVFYRQNKWVDSYIYPNEMKDFV